MGRTVLLVHSPLVGSSTMRPLAERLDGLGHHVLLPDLTGCATSADPHGDLVDTATTAGRRHGTVDVLAGHSGAGAFLPAIASDLGGVGAVIFLDAVLPPLHGPHRTSPALHELLDRLAVDGMLPQWLDWWPAETIARLLPDPAAQEELRRDMPCLPRSFYDVDVPVPAEWPSDRAAYLRLSPAYDAELADATDRGWPTERMDSTHLAVHTDASAIAERCLLLLDRIS